MQLPFGPDLSISDLSPSPGETLGSCGIPAEFIRFLFRTRRAHLSLIRSFARQRDDWSVEKRGGDFSPHQVLHIAGWRNSVAIPLPPSSASVSRRTKPRRAFISAMCSNCRPAISYSTGTSQSMRQVGRPVLPPSNRNGLRSPLGKNDALQINALLPQGSYGRNSFNFERSRPDLFGRNRVNQAHRLLSCFSGFPKWQPGETSACRHRLRTVRLEN